QEAARNRGAINRLEKDEIGAINYRIEQARLRARKLDFVARQDPGRDLGAERAEIARTNEAAQAAYREKQKDLDKLVEGAASRSVTFATADGREKELRTLDVY